jgi:hypothetical protein
LKAKQIKVEVLLGAIVVLVVAGAGGMLVRPAQIPDQVLRARTGDVIWNHDLHARMPEIGNCTVCHHTERIGTTSPKPCEDCHTLWTNAEAVVLPDLFMEVEEPVYSGEQGPPAMTVFHGKCIGCHKAMTEGPVGCRDCHAQTFSGSQGIVEWDHRAHARQMDVDCVRCHHKDTEATWDGEYRGCRNCHKPASVLGLPRPTNRAEHQEAKHGECFKCHTQFNPENDLRSCIDCHKDMTVVEEGKAPSIEEAIHKRCMECHNRAYRDLTPFMPIICRDCHKPDPSLITAPGLGPVLFSHKRHADYETWECDECHHTDVPGEPQTACYRCHGADLFADIPSLPEAMHKRCLGCHEEKGVGLVDWNSFRSPEADLSLFQFESGETSFWWDHRFHAVSLALSCRDCHHNYIRKDGEYVTAARTKATWPQEAGNIQTCRNCHGPEGPVPGSAAEGTEAKNLEGAFKKICIECHKRFEAGPVEWEDFFKLQDDTEAKKGSVGIDIEVQNDE